MSSQDVEVVLKRIAARSEGEVHSGLNDLRTLRVTSAELIEQCPMRWYSELPVNNSTYPKKPKEGVDFGLIGTLIHALGEQHLGRVCQIVDYNEEDDLTTEESALINIALGTMLPDKEVNNWTRYQTRLARKFAGSELLSREKRWEIPCDIGYRVTGGIDSVLRDRDGKIWLLDHKTERKPHTKGYWRSKLQIVSYVAAIGQYYDVEEVGVFIGLVNLPEDCVFTLNVANSLHSIRERYALIEQSIRNGAQERKAGAACRYCLLSDVCDKNKNRKEFKTGFKTLGRIFKAEEI
jgi:hypothetical protein